jgi:cytochrome c
MIKSPAALVAVALGLSVSLAEPSGAQAVRTAPAAVPAGLPSDAAFKRRCAMCHAVAGKGGKMGPDLAGVVGRKAGASAYSYSQAMKGSKVVWNAAALDAYLAAPSKMIPGTKMTISVSQAEDRKAIIAYLASTKR